MKTTRMMTKLLLAAVAVPAATTVAAHAFGKPTVVVMHRNIHNQQDEQNWVDLAQGLADYGYRVISVAMDRYEPASVASNHVLRMLHNESPEGKILLVGTRRGERCRVRGRRGRA